MTVAKQARSLTVARITAAGVLMAMNIALSSYGIPVPGGHLYLCDVVICLAGLMLGPVEAFAVGGIGSFLGDLFFYPLPMFVSLATHGLQAVAVSLISHRALKSRPRLASVIAVAVGAVIMVTGYTLGKWFIYSTPEYALLKLPFQILQAVTGAVVSIALCWKFGLVKLWQRLVSNAARW